VLAQLLVCNAERHVCAIVSSADWGSSASRNASQSSASDRASATEHTLRSSSQRLLPQQGVRPERRSERRDCADRRCVVRRLANRRFAPVPKGLCAHVSFGNSGATAPHDLRVRAAMESLSNVYRIRRSSHLQDLYDALLRARILAFDIT